MVLAWRSNWVEHLPSQISIRRRLHRRESFPAVAQKIMKLSVDVHKAQEAMLRRIKPRTVYKRVQSIVPLQIQLYIRADHSFLDHSFCRLHTIYTTSKLESHKARSYAVISALYIFLLSLNFSHFLGIISLLMTTIFYWLYFPHCIFHIHDIRFVTGSLYHFISLNYLSPLSNALSTDNHMFLLSICDSVSVLLCLAICFDF